MLRRLFEIVGLLYRPSDTFEAPTGYEGLSQASVGSAETRFPIPYVHVSPIPPPAGMLKIYDADLSELAELQSRNAQIDHHMSALIERIAPTIESDDERRDFVRDHLRSAEERKSRIDYEQPQGSPYRFYPAFLDDTDFETQQPPNTATIATVSDIPPRDWDALENPIVPPALSKNWNLAAEPSAEPKLLAKDWNKVEEASGTLRPTKDWSQVSNPAIGPSVGKKDWGATPELAPLKARTRSMDRDR